MPIDRSDFEKGKAPTLAERVEKYLSSRPAQAFTLVEIAKGLHSPAARDTDRVVTEKEAEARTAATVLRGAIARLVAERKIEVKTLSEGGRSVDYYVWRRLPGPSS